MPSSYLTVALLYLLGAAFGCGTILAVLADAFALAQLQILALAKLFAWLHSRQVGLLTALFRLFRGQKRNLLASRTEPQSFDAAHSLVGVLLFIAVAVLTPVPFAYHAYFTALFSYYTIVYYAYVAAAFALHRVPVFDVLTSVLGLRDGDVVLTRYLPASGVAAAAPSQAMGYSTEFYVVRRTRAPMSDVIVAWLDVRRLWRLATGKRPFKSIVRRAVIGEYDTS